MPSPLKRGKNQSTPASVLVCSIPLKASIPYDLAAFLPAYIWMNSTFTTGVLCMKSTDGRAPSPWADLVIFSSSGRTLFRLVQQVPWRILTKSTRKKLFWNVAHVPNKVHDNVASAVVSGYLFIFPCDKSRFALTWFQEMYRGEETNLIVVEPMCEMIYQSALLDRVDITRWNIVDCDGILGLVGEGLQLNVPQLIVVHEAHLELGRIVTDICRRRPNLNYLQSWDLYAEIVGIRNGGRIATFLIGFEGTKARSSFIGVFVKVDLFQGSYKELNWIKEIKVASESERRGLRRWMARACLCRRMRDLGVGPYSVDPSLKRVWTDLCKDNMTKQEARLDFDSDAWRMFLDFTDDSSCQRPTNLQKPSIPSRISRDSLYPDAQLFDNFAVINLLPIRSMTALSAPVELVYSTEEDDEAFVGVDLLT
jgi:hypothetical protein